MAIISYIIISSALAILASLSYRIHRFRKRINNYQTISDWSTYISVSDAIIVYLLYKHKKEEQHDFRPLKFHRATHKPCVLTCFNDCISVDCYSKEVCPICSPKSWFDLNKALEIKYSCVNWLCFWRCGKRELVFGDNSSYSSAKTNWPFTKLHNGSPRPFTVSL